MTRRILLCVAQLCLLLSGCLTAAAYSPQARDYLTPKEVDLVKDAQELDKRVDVFIKAANRRLVVIKGLETDTKELKKDAEFWGDLPTGTRSELVGDIAGILNAAIDNIDDVSSRDEKNPALPRVLRKLADAASHISEQLKPLQQSATDPAEVRNFDELMENAETIVQAASKLGPEVIQPRKSKGEKGKTN